MDRIQNIDNSFSFHHYLVQSKFTQRIFLFLRGTYAPFKKPFSLIPLQSWENVNPITEFKIEKSDNFVVYFVFFSAKCKSVYEYNGLNMDPAFFDSKFVDFDLICVKNKRGEVFFVPKDRR